ncbi:MAG: TdeIII family type II restriction endonuclease [Muribaculaceae bacterium]|nr:TdeIII family type II restriction endonuclease [Muribaculaceae bacterium]
MVPENNLVTEGIRKVITELMDSVLNNVLVTHPFVPEEHHAKKPLYAALVPDEIFKGSHFERRFVTPFGSAWERLALVVSSVHLGKGTLQATVEGNILDGRLKRIQEVLNAEDHATGGKKKRKPDWEEDLKYVLQGKGNPIPTTVICDLLVEHIKTGKKYALELKAPLPNSDQTKVSKEKMLKLMAMENHPVDQAFYGLVYNPYGSRKDYAWSYPKKWFNIEKDRNLLIGDELWDFLGGKGTYQNFISEINSLGIKYKEIIYRDYLKIEPLHEMLEIKLK